MRIKEIIWSIIPECKRTFRTLKEYLFNRLQNTVANMNITYAVSSNDK